MHPRFCGPRPFGFPARRDAFARQDFVGTDFMGRDFPDRDFFSREDGEGGEGRARRGGFGGRGFGGGRFGEGRPGRGPGRFFGHGDLRLVVLHRIAEKPAYGYEIIKAIEERVGGAYSPSPGVIYPTLTMLEELGHATVEPGEGAKKLYAVTDEGRAYLAAHRPAVEALLARMDEAARARGGGPAPQILRAMENLRMALHLRLARGPLTEAQIREVAAALDAAATAVERT